MSDQSHFTRSFRRIVGESPSSWRQTRRGAIEELVTELPYPGTTKPIVMEKTPGTLLAPQQLRDGLNAVAPDPYPR